MTIGAYVATRRFEGFAGGGLVADVWGANDAPTVLLLHGSGQTRHAWSGTARALAVMGWRAVTLDLPGHGDSGWAPDGDYRTPTLAHAMRGVWHELGQPLAVVGASFAGLLSIATAARADAPSLAALVLVDVAPRMEDAGRSRVRGFMAAHLDGFGSLDEAAGSIAGYLNRPVEGRLEGLAKNLRQNECGRWVWHWDPRLIADSNRRNRPEAEWYEGALRDLRCPILLVRGLRSDLVSDKSVWALRQAVPGVQVVDVVDAGHMVAGDANDAFCESLAPFLRTAMPPASASQRGTEP